MRNHMLTVVAVLLLSGAAAFAGSFTNTFTNPNDISGFTLNGGTTGTGLPYPTIDTAQGGLVLTYAEGSLQGSCVLDDLDAGQPIDSFTAKFNLMLSSGGTADGVSFCFASEITSSSVWGEEGTGTGISVEFDTYNNGAPDQIGIDVKVGGTEIAKYPMTQAQINDGIAQPITVQLKQNGTLTVIRGATTIFQDLVLPGWAPIAGSFGFGARTGGAFELAVLTDLGITTHLAPATAVKPTVTTQPANVPNLPELGTATFKVVYDGSAPISLQWTKNGVNIPDATNAVLTLTDVKLADNNAKIACKISNASGSVTTSDATLTVIADTTPPVLQYATGGANFKKVRVWFSESVDPVTAQKASNYQLSGGVTITSATVSAPAGSPGDNIVDLVTSAQTPSQTYTLTVNGVKDRSAAGNTVAANSTVQFISYTLAPGYLTFEVWNGLSTTDNVLTNTLTVDPRFPNSPDLTAYITAFTSRQQYPDDSHEGYGGRMSGYLIPTESGNYTFFLRSDDSSQLFISTDDTAAKAVLVAEETGCCQNFLEPDPGQGGAWHDNGAGMGQTTLNPISLVAGKKYYIAALWKEGTGGDYCMVAWRKDGDTTAAALLPAIPGQYLSTYADPNVELTFTTQPTDQVGVVASTGIEIFTRDFNANDGGFTVENTDPAPEGPWTYDSATGAWVAEGSADACGTPNNSRLTSPPYTLTQDGAVSLSFSHRYSFEPDRYDGGVVRISVNGGDFTIVPAANFTANGYNSGVIQGNGILLGLQAFHDDSPGYSASQFITSKVTLGTFSKNDVLLVQFLGAWDECTAGKRPNWVIDSVKMDLLPMTIQDFAKSNGNFTVENTPATPPAGWGAFTYITTNGQWVANGANSECGGPFNSKLTSPAYVVPQSDEVTLSFSHRYSFEGDRYDGGQVRISVNGGAFTPVPAEAFTANGYAAGVIQGNGILKDQAAFNGDSTGYAAGSFITSSAVLGTFNKNDTIAVQFVGAWDECSGASIPSWSIKNLQLVFGKSAKASTFTAVATAIQRGQSAPFNYQWQRNDGAGFVNIPGATGSTFVIYPTAADMSATFRVVVTVPGKTVNSNVAKLVTEAVVEPPNIALARSGTSVIITYTGTLQSAATVKGDYQNVQGAQSPYTVPTTANAQFYRSAK